MVAYEGGVRPGPIIPGPIVPPRIPIPGSIGGFYPGMPEYPSAEGGLPGNYTNINSGFEGGGPAPGFDPVGGSYGLVPGEGGVAPLPPGPPILPPDPNLEGGGLRREYGKFRQISTRGGPQNRPSNNAELLRRAAARRLGLD